MGKEYNIGRLHWDMSDSRTILALAQHQITNDDLKYTNYILDIVERQIKSIIRQGYVHDNKINMRNEDGTPNMAAINLAVESDFSKKWSRGLLPIMTKNVSKMLMSGNAALAGKGIKLVTQTANPEQYFSEMVDLNESITNSEVMTSLFENQLHGGGSFYLWR